MKQQKLKLKVGTRCLMAIGFIRRGDSKITISPKKVVKITAINAKGYSIGKSNFDFNGHEKVDKDSMQFAVALPISYKEAQEITQKQGAKIRLVKDLLKKRLEAEKLVALIDSQLKLARQ